MEDLILYSGITIDSWNNVWKNKNLLNKNTNVTKDESFAIDYSYNFNTGAYEDLIIEISNIPLEAFVGYRKKNYKNDEDYKLFKENISEDKKIEIINQHSLFLLNLEKYKNTIKINLIKDGKILESANQQKINKIKKKY